MHPTHGKTVRCVSRSAHALTHHVTGTRGRPSADRSQALRVNTVTGDRYGGEWAREPFRKAGISYEVASKPKSDLYVAFLPLLTSQMVELVDQPRLIQQIVGLERRTARGGRNSIDHGPNGHDDLSNVVAGVCAMFESKSRYDFSLAWVCDDEALDLQRQEQLAFNRFILSGGMR